MAEGWWQMSDDKSLMQADHRVHTRMECNNADNRVESFVGVTYAIQI